MYNMHTKNSVLLAALDPSTPLTAPDDASEVLDANDATLVVVLRTSNVSIYSPFGHVDFFPNGGEVQAGCDLWFYPDFGKYFSVLTPSTHSYLTSYQASETL